MKTKMISKNTIYMLMQMSFWMVYCCCYGFVSYYLLEKGFSTSIVGIVSAIAGIISAVGQPVIGAIADKPGVGYKKTLVTSLILLFLFGIILIVFSAIHFDAGTCLAYGIVMLILGIATPLVNAAGVAYNNEINFGMARGMGSFGYALASYIMGYLTALVGAVIIPIAIVIISTVMLFITLSMPNKVGEETLEETLSGQLEENPSGSGFLNRYPAFTMLWIVLICMLTVHSLSNTYLLQILEKGGGNSKNLGTSVAIAALMEIPMIFYYEKVNRWISTKNLLVLAAFTYLLKSVLQLLNTNLFVFYMIQLLQLTSWGIYASASVYYAKEHIPEEDQTRAQAYMANALTIGNVIGTLIGGRLIDIYGVNAMLLFQCFMGALSLIGIVIWKFKYHV